MKHIIITDNATTDMTPSSSIYGKEEQLKQSRIAQWSDLGPLRYTVMKEITETCITIFVACLDEYIGVAGSGETQLEAMQGLQFAMEDLSVLDRDRFKGDVINVLDSEASDNVVIIVNSGFL